MVKGWKEDTRGCDGKGEGWALTWHPSVTFTFHLVHLRFLDDNYQSLLTGLCPRAKF